MSLEEKDRLARRREVLGRTIGQVAEAAGFPAWKVRALEDGQVSVNELSHPELAALAAGLSAGRRRPGRREDLIKLYMNMSKKELIEELLCSEFDPKPPELQERPC